MADIYSTAVLARVVQNMLLPSSFLLDRYFTNEIRFDTEEVAIDIFVGKRRLAPFVHPLREGRFVESLKFQTALYRPPYVKDKRKLDPRRAIRRAIGERIGGDLTPQERTQVNLGLEMEDQMGMLTRRMEQMAASALASGTVTLQGDGFPTATISFGRSANLNVVLTGASRWGQAGVSPAADIEDWAARVVRESGRKVREITFTNAAWKAFRADPMVAQVIASFANGNPNFAAAGVNRDVGAVYLGTWGEWDLYLYNDWYIDPVDGVEKPMLADGTVILGSPDIEGTRAFGVILDEDIGFPVQGFAAKSWVEKDPGVRWLLMQAAPLVIPTNVNASLGAQVI
ncbi:major capsid protein [Roseomonas sp. USHLN139]|uniref:major capsid protein n=1 Tax=Roseomonas sp. USHLN139 TaxID=3081298 RepID=UPI003B01A8CE